MKKILWPAVFLCTGIAEADHFPAEVGYWWEFSYTRSSSGLAEYRTDSGTVNWEIYSIEVMESYPTQIRIRIKETKRIVRRYGSFIEGTGGFQERDTTYNPPLIMNDTVVLHSLGNSNGLWYEGDSCWSFVHDPQGEIPQGKLELRNVTITLFNQKLEAVEIDPSSCREGAGASGSPAQYYAPRYFTTADNYGPVAFHAQSPSGLLGADWSEDWILLNTNVGGVGGPCDYDEYAGTATITRISPVQDRSTAYEAFFTFETDAAIDT
ncbi:MAG: hypothetical protein GF350_11540, partial [Chitinivibrionales bacterium]|nr:hypothetical protein [Chitinivibrionales bacterium]